jgi:hypothetical protein
VKQMLFSCDQCGVQATQDPEWTGMPHGWAVIRYERTHDMPIKGGGDEMQTVTTTSTTYACGDCAERVLDALEPKAPKAEEKVA